MQGDISIHSFLSGKLLVQNVLFHTQKKVKMRNQTSCNQDENKEVNSQIPHECSILLISDKKMQKLEHLRQTETRVFSNCTQLKVMCKIKLM